MRPLHCALLAGALLGSPAAAGFTYTATLTQDGQEQPHAIEFVPTDHVHLPFRNATAPAALARFRSKRDSIVYSKNWCGAVQHAPAGDTFSSTTGSFTVPDLSLRPSIGTPQYASASVGVDGVTCQNVFLQAGATTQIMSDGSQIVSVWFEWFPDVAYTIAGFPAKPGEWLTVTIVPSSKLAAKVTVTNVNTGTSVDLRLTGTTNLCLADTEWLLDDTFEGINDQLPFARFNDVWFEQVQAKTGKGSAVGLSGAAYYALLDTASQVKCMASNYDDSNFYVYSVN